MDFKAHSIIALPKPKGTGVILKNGKEICNFTNAITLFGKIHIMNALLRDCTATKPIIPKIIGLSLLFRRMSDTGTENNANINKSFFEVIIAKDGLVSAHPDGNPTDIDDRMPNDETGHGISGSNAHFGCVEVKPVASTGNYGDTDMAFLPGAESTWYNKVWKGNNTTPNTATTPPHAQSVGLSATDTNCKKARIAGISLITNDLGDHTATGSKKVWRDPTYLEIINSEEAYGAGIDNVITGITQGGNADLHAKIIGDGHYFPSQKALAVSAIETGNTDEISRQEVQDSNTWTWEDVAHDTFATTYFLSHYFGSSDTFGDGSTLGGGVKPTSIAQQAPDYDGSTASYNIPKVGTTSLGGGDMLLADTPQNVANSGEVDINNEEVNYDVGGSGTDNSVDYNDQITAKYTINFENVGLGGANDPNDYGVLDQSYSSSLIGYELAKTFGVEANLGNWVSQYEPNDPVPVSIKRIGLKDVADQWMKLELDTQPLNGTTSAPLLEDIITTGDDGDGKTKWFQVARSGFANGVPSLQGSGNLEQTFPDYLQGRPRVVKASVKIKFANLNHSDAWDIYKGGGVDPLGYSADPKKGNPDTIHFYGGDAGTTFLFSCTLGDSGTGVIGVINPYSTSGSTSVSGTQAGLVKLSDGADFTSTSNIWEDKNNLITTLNFYIS